MNIYTDKWQRYHDKPTDGVNPSSNNCWIYTAYMKKAVGFDYTIELLLAGIECSKSRLRHPLAYRQASEQVPFSRDERLGLEYLGFDMQDWMFNPSDRPIPNLSIPKLVTQALSLVVVIPYYKRILGVDVKLWHFELAHRNFFWKNNLSQLYRFAFSTPIQDRYSILKWSGRFKWYKPAHIFYAGVSLVDRMGKPSGIRYLKYGGEKNMRAMVQEFPADHPIRVKVGM